MNAWISCLQIQKMTEFFYRKISNGGLVHVIEMSDAENEEQTNFSLNYIFLYACDVPFM